MIRTLAAISLVLLTAAPIARVSAARLTPGYDDIEGFLTSSGDFDRDVIPDLALTGAVDSTGVEFLALWMNDGSSNFSDISSTGLVDSSGSPGAKGEDSLEAVLADIDLDGWLDAVVLNTYFNINQADSGDFDLLQLAAGVVSGSSPDGIVVYLYENTNR